MNIIDLKQSDKLFVTASDIADIVGSDPQDIRVQARVDATALGFPVTLVKNRLKIPRVPFLHYLGMEVMQNEIM